MNEIYQIKLDEDEEYDVGDMLNIWELLKMQYYDYDVKFKITHHRGSRSVEFSFYYIEEE